MAEFRITAINATDGSEKVFFYDNLTSIIKNEEGVQLEFGEKQTYADWYATKPDAPIGKSKPKVVKITMGLMCNYECSYCSQRLVPRPEATHPEDVMPLVNGMDSWFDAGDDGLGTGRRIELWGGEPFVYWKTLKPLAEALRAKYPNVTILVITNGSLLDQEKNDWIEAMDIHIGMSHDGPGYHARGLDPLDDPEKKKWIMDLWGRLRPKGKMSVNAVLHKGNRSREAVQSFLEHHFGEDILVGEGTLIDTYDGEAIAQTLSTFKDHFSYRNQALSEIRDGKAMKFNVLGVKVKGFIESIKSQRPLSAVGQKCGMDDPSNIAIDLHGNVQTCQNISIAGPAPNGRSHLMGHVSDLKNVKLEAATHFMNRAECPSCPVVQLCKGACMFLEDELWEVTCNHSYSDNVVFFAAAFEVLTGYVPVKIEGDGLRPERTDVLGALSDWTASLNKPVSRWGKKFPIPVVAT